MCDSLCDLYSGLSGQGRIEAGNRSAEMFRREVGVAHHHRQRRVPKQILHLLQCRSPLDGPGRERMPQVVVVKVDQLGPSDGGLEGGTEVIPTPGAEDQPGRVDPRAAGEYGICPAVERHLAATAILGDVDRMTLARSTRSQVKESSSPWRSPVKSPNSTRSNRSAFRDSRQTSRRRLASSGVSHRRRPSGSFSILIRGTTSRSSHSSCASRRSVVAARARDSRSRLRRP